VRFYRSLAPVSAISFDLDDTLYANQPVIAKAEEESHQALQQWHSALRSLSLTDYQWLRAQLCQQQPELANDLTALRRQSVQAIMQQAGLSQALSREGSEHILSIFHHWRNKVQISTTTHRLLAELAQRIPLIAITNGNACLKTTGIADYFQRTYRAGPDGRAKPWPDLFTKAAQDLNLAAEQILHVGDNLQADVLGAIQQGYQACWYNHRGQQSLSASQQCRLLPHLEITRIEALGTLTFTTDSGKVKPTQ
jgi:FMN hydrolase / 5-amino-6-(5-phospho-D-ribitylamino)uracil phosphatase